MLKDPSLVVVTFVTAEGVSLTVLWLNIPCVSACVQSSGSFQLQTLLACIACGLG